MDLAGVSFLAVSFFVYTGLYGCGYDGPWERFKQMISCTVSSFFNCVAQSSVSCAGFVDRFIIGPWRQWRSEEEWKTVRSTVANHEGGRLAFTAAPTVAGASQARIRCAMNFLREAHKE